MRSAAQNLIVRTGDYKGLGRIYDRQGGLIVGGSESVLKIAENWDFDVMSPWRQVLPHVVFEGFGGKAKSRLWVTTERLVLIREIDLWRQLKGELTPLGLPNAAEKEARLKRVIAAGARQFCEIRPANLRVVKSKALNRRRSWLDMQLMGIDGRQYAVTNRKTDGRDTETLALVESRFPRQ